MVARSTRFLRKDVDLHFHIRNTNHTHMDTLGYRKCTSHVDTHGYRESHTHTHTPPCACAHAHTHLNPKPKKK